MALFTAIGGIFTALVSGGVFSSLGDVAIEMAVTFADEDDTSSRNDETTGGSEHELR